MTPAMNAADFAAMGPLLIVLLGALLTLLIESFAEAASKKWSFYVTVGTLLLALAAAIYAPASANPMLTPWLRFDALARVFTLLFLGIGLSSVLLAASFFRTFEATQGEYYFLILSALFGLILIGSSADFLTLFLGLETLSIPLYILCGYMKRWEISHEAAIKYFLIGALGAAFLLYGIALLYGAVGTTSFDGLLAKYRDLASSQEKALFMSGIALITLGLAFKAAIVPFHVWAPDVYDGAPTPVTAFMAVGTKAGAFAAFGLLFLAVLPNFDLNWNEGLTFLAYVTLIYANYVALLQAQLRRFFAYSGISHAGFMLIPLIAGTPDALQALLYYIAIYAFATLGSFAVLVLIDNKAEGVVLHDLRGLFRRSPLLAGFFALCLLTLAGIPPTAGFFAKFYIFKVAFQAGYYPLVVVALLTTILAAFYYVRIITVMLSEGAAEAAAPRLSWPAAVVGIAAFAAIAVFSCFPAPLLDLLHF